MKLPMTGGAFAPAKLKGQRYVLYFYPRDNTSGCTLEATEFSAAARQFRKLGWEVFGVSADSMASHEKFTAKLGLAFPLVSDEEEKLCKLYDVIKMKSLYGRKFRGIERSTFLVGEQGKILREWRKVKVNGHVEEVLAAAKELS